MKIRPEKCKAMIVSAPLPLIASSMLVFGLLTLNGCTSPQPLRLPPVTANPTGDYQVGKPVWFDLLTEDVLAAKGFYGQLFRWKFEQSEGYPQYSLIYNESTPIGGMVPHENRDGESPESRWLISLSVQDVDEAVSRVTKNGGTVLQGPLDVEARGRMALVADPAGAPLILMRATGGDPAETEPASGALFWTDLFTSDATAAGEFYAPLANYTPETVEVGEEHEYRILIRDGRKQAGIVELKWEQFEANWLPYVKVDDVKQIVAEAQKLGASIILQLDNVAILADPTGAAFGIQGPRKEEFMMKLAAAVFGIICLLTSCAGGSGNVVYGHYYGVSPWWGSRDTYRDNIIVVPPDRGPELEAMPLPSGPEAMPAIGSPDL